MQVEVYKINGTPTGEMLELDASVFGIEPNDHAIYMAVRSIQANQHQGTHKVKPRNEVRGGGKKPFKQKKTGRARAGTTRSPLWVGGGFDLWSPSARLRREYSGKSSQAGAKIRLEL